MKTDLSNIELPSNRKFGFFFSGVFLASSIYFYFSGSFSWLFLFFTLALIFFITTILKADVLYPINKLWMRLGLILGKIISPIVLGIIFFLLFTPVGIVMRVFRRDELRLILKKKLSHWIKHETDSKSESFKNQF